MYCTCTLIDMYFLQEGSLRVNDRLLAVNNQSLVNMSNASALEGLKKGLQQATPTADPNIRLVCVYTLCFL